MRFVAIIVLISFWCATLLNPVCYAQLKQGKTKIALLEFDFTGLSPIVVDDISDRFREEINRMDNYYVMSRNRIQDILIEKAPTISGPITEMNEIKEVGKILEADQVIAGTVGKVADAYVIQVKLIDLRTNETREEFGRLAEGTLVEFLDVTVKEVAQKITGYVPPAPVAPAVTPLAKPWYKKWYVLASGGGAIVLVAAVLLMSGGGGGNGDGDEGDLPGPPTFP